MGLATFLKRIVELFKTVLKSKLKRWNAFFAGEKKLLVLVPLPPGWRHGVCPRCGSSNISGALITESSDPVDPNFWCCDCSFWRE